MSVPLAGNPSPPFVSRHYSWPDRGGVQPSQAASGQQPPFGKDRPYQIDQNWTLLYPEYVFSQGPPSCKLVSLTFDDAPDDLFGPVLLDILMHYNVKATFFCLGECVRQNSKTAQRIVREGHIIGNHSHDHTDLTTIPPDKIRDEVQKAETEIKQVTSLRTALFRPPFGALNAQSIQVILSMGYRIILWNVDSMDWTGLTGPSVAARVIAAAAPGSIILMHNACGGSLEAGTGAVQSLPFIIETLRAQGYDFTTVSSLLNIPAYQ